MDLDRGHHRTDHTGGDGVRAAFRSGLPDQCPRPGRRQERRHERTGRTEFGPDGSDPDRGRDRNCAFAGRIGRGGRKRETVFAGHAAVPARHRRRPRTPVLGKGAGRTPVRTGAIRLGRRTHQGRPPRSSSRAVWTAVDARQGRRRWFSVAVRRSSAARRPGRQGQRAKRRGDFRSAARRAAGDEIPGGPPQLAQHAAIAVGRSDGFGTRQTDRDTRDRPAGHFADTHCRDAEHHRRDLPAPECRAHLRGRCQDAGVSGRAIARAEGSVGQRRVCPQPVSCAGRHGGPDPGDAGVAGNAGRSREPAIGAGIEAGRTGPALHRRASGSCGDRPATHGAGGKPRTDGTADSSFAGGRTGFGPPDARRAGRERTVHAAAEPGPGAEGSPCGNGRQHPDHRRGLRPATADQAATLAGGLTGADPGSPGQPDDSIPARSDEQ